MLPMFGTFIADIDGVHIGLLFHSRQNVNNPSYKEDHRPFLENLLNKQYGNN